MEDVRIYDELENHWRIVLEDNDGRVENEKAILHMKHR